MKFMRLPDGWRFGRESVNKKTGDTEATLFYKDQWVSRLVVNRNIESNAKKVIANPHARAYPILFKDGKLDFTHHKCEQGIWRLIEEGLITVEQGYKILPNSRFIEFAKRRGVWDPSLEPPKKPKVLNIIEFGGRKYLSRNGSWYDVTDGEVPLPKKLMIHSNWEARVMMGRGQCRIEDVAEYSLTAVLECAGDLVACNIKNGESVYKDITSRLEAAMENPILRGFNSKKEPIYSMKIDSNSPRWLEFCSILRKVCRLEYSGYEARLRYVNGYNVTIQLEHKRFKKELKRVLNGASTERLIHIPFLRNFKSKLDSMGLSEARDYAQKKFAELFSVGPYDEEKRLSFFHHAGQYYGLWVDSGKIFRPNPPVTCWSIPFGFDKIPEEQRREILGEAFDYVDEDWCKQARRARRSYFFLTRCKGLSYRRARFIVIRKHLRTNYKKLDWKLKIEKFSCAEVNKKATSMELIHRVVCEVA